MQDNTTDDDKVYQKQPDDKADNGGAVAAVFHQAHLTAVAFERVVEKAEEPAPFALVAREVRVAV